MNAVITSACLLLAAMTSVEAADGWRDFDKDDATVLVGKLPLSAGESQFVESDDDGSLSIVVPPGQAATVPLGSFPIEGMKADVYALQLDVEFQVTSSPAYFEMWTTLSNGGRFFSKTLSSSGPTSHLLGAKSHHEVLVPASIKGSEVKATHCDLSLVLPGGGSVKIHRARMLDVPAGFRLIGMTPGQWYPGWMGGVIGAIFGVLCGCLGAFYGYAWRTGTAWNAMQYFPTAMGMMSGVILIAGVVALVVKQPYHVWYPLMLVGVLGVVLAPTIRWQTMKQVSQNLGSFEDRRMQAMDA